MIDLIWDHITCRFGILKKIICDDDPQFVGAKVTEFLVGMHIKWITSTLYHLNENGQQNGVAKPHEKLEIQKGCWVEELSVLL